MLHRLRRPFADEGTHLAKLIGPKAHAMSTSPPSVGLEWDNERCLGASGDLQVEEVLLSLPGSLYLEQMKVSMMFNKLLNDSIQSSSSTACPMIMPSQSSRNLQESEPVDQTYNQHGAGYRGRVSTS